MDVVVAYIADALVTPATTDLTVPLDDLTHSKVLRVSYDKDRIERLGCYCKDVIGRVWCIARTLRRLSTTYERAVGSILT